MLGGGGRGLVAGERSCIMEGLGELSLGKSVGEQLQRWEERHPLTPHEPSRIRREKESSQDQGDRKVKSESEPFFGGGGGRERRKTRDFTVVLRA